MALLFYMSDALCLWAQCTKRYSVVVALHKAINNNLGLSCLLVLCLVRPPVLVTSRLLLLRRIQFLITLSADVAAAVELKAINWLGLIYDHLGSDLSDR